MTYNHPFWDPPSQADETAAWALVQKGMAAQQASAREKLYLAAIAELYKDAGAGTREERNERYRDAMGAVHDKFPDDETKLFYGLSILGAIPGGFPGFQQLCGQAAELFEEVYSRHPDHPGALHYLIHAYDVPEHAQQDPFAKSIIGLQAKEAEAFASEAIGDADGAVAKLKEAAAIEDAIDDVSQPPYPVLRRSRGQSRRVGDSA